MTMRLDHKTYSRLIVSISNLEYEPTELPLIPSSVDVDMLPPKLRDGDKPLTVEEAYKTYVKFERSAWEEDGRTSSHMRHRKNCYSRILEADRRFQQEFDGLTTAKLSRYVSVQNNDGELLTLWELDETLNSPSVRQRIRRCLNYHIEEKLGLEYEWVAVTSVNPLNAVPREYIYMWIDDPGNEVLTDHISPALEKHIDGCDTATQDMHNYRKSGDGGSITFDRTPSVVDFIPEQLPEILQESETPPTLNTMGAYFVAGELIHLPVGDYGKSEQSDPRINKLIGATLAWASPHKWFRPSGGIPNL